jgi:hypothetical protein
MRHERLSIGTSVSIVKGVSLICPFCGGTVDMGDLSDGGVGAIHTIPFCDTFDRLSVDEFAYACRVAIEATVKTEQSS